MIQRSGAGTVAGNGAASSRMIAVRVSALLSRANAFWPVDQLVEDQPERELIRLRPDRREPARLFRRHVVHRADRGARAGERRARVLIAGRVADRLGDAEVENLHAAVARSRRCCRA